MQLTEYKRTSCCYITRKLCQFRCLQISSKYFTAKIIIILRIHLLRPLNHFPNYYLATYFPYITINFAHLRSLLALITPRAYVIHWNSFMHSRLQLLKHLVRMHSMNRGCNILYTSPDFFFLFITCIIPTFTKRDARYHSKLLFKKKKVYNCYEQNILKKINNKTIIELTRLFKELI